MSRHIGQFESLRGIAATWVFVAHAMAIAKVVAWPFDAGNYAVEVFMILSGFVITLLVNRRPEPYGGYIFRRCMRLYPMFLIALCLGWATQDFARGAFEPVLFGRVSDPDFYAVVKGAALVPNLLLHLTMLHGVVPNNVLPHAVTAFSGPLWSLSLEWQFYLVAPLFIWLLDFRKHKGWIVAGITLVCILATQAAVRKVWHGDMPAFLPLRMLLFAVGILSGHLWDRARKIPLKRVAAFWAVCIVIEIGLHRSISTCIPYMIWAVVYVIAAGNERHTWFSVPNRFFLIPGLRWIGERSYGFYVLHLPILLTVAALVVVPNARRT